MFLFPAFLVLRGSYPEVIFGGKQNDAASSSASALAMIGLLKATATIVKQLIVSVSIQNLRFRFEWSLDRCERLAGKFVAQIVLSYCPDNSSLDA